MREFLRALGGLGYAVALMLGAGLALTALTLAWGWLARVG